MKRKDPRAWGAVLEWIEQDLLSGRLHPGDRLPLERTIATTLGVRLKSVREALRVLEVLGLVRNDGPRYSETILIDGEARKVLSHKSSCDGSIRIREKRIDDDNRSTCEASSDVRRQKG